MILMSNDRSPMVAGTNEFFSLFTLYFSRAYLQPAGRRLYSAQRRAQSAFLVALALYKSARSCQQIFTAHSHNIVQFCMFLRVRDQNKQVLENVNHMLN